MKNRVLLELVLVLGVILSASSTMCVFELNLNYLVKYISSLPEHPNEHIKEPRNTLSAIIDHIAVTLGLKSALYFSASDFEKIMKEVLERRSMRYMQGRLVEKMTPQAGDQFIVWGALNGAFHSLVYDLVELKKQGHISEEFILADTCYFIFNGDAIGESDYALETFMLIVYLMYKNPQRVIYIKGDQEDKEHGHKTLLDRQVTITNASWFNKYVYVQSSQLLLFFNSLPLALYALSSEKQDMYDTRIIRFSYYASDYAELNEASFSYFFDRYTPSVISLLDKVTLSATVDYKIVAYIYAQVDKLEYAPSPGLLLKAKGEGHIYWTTMSSPTLWFHKQYQFFNDAFVVLVTADDIDAWTIQLYYQDVRKRLGFKKDHAYYVVNGDHHVDPLQAKVKQLKQQLQELNYSKQKLYDNCLPGIDK